MAEKKISISWDDVYSKDVDSKLKQQHDLARAQQNASTNAKLAPQLPATGRVIASGSIWYNTLFYMTIFGFAGGLLAWAAAEIVTILGKTNAEKFEDLRVEAYKIERDFRDGKLTQTQAESAMKALTRKASNNPYFKVMDDDSLTSRERERRIEEMIERDKSKRYVVNMLLLALCGTLISTFLSIAECAVSRNPRGTLINGSVGAMFGLIGGIIVSLFIDSLYQALGGGGGDDLGKQMLARSVAWGVLGLFLSIAPGIVLRNWKRLVIGLVGGLIGGILGGILFDPIGKWTDSAVFSRFVGFTAIGAITGLGTGLVENVAKTGWLRVVAGLIAGKQFILYRNPTIVGSSPQCEIYLFKDAQISPQHAALHLVGGGFELEDLKSGSGTYVNGQLITRVRIRHGDYIQISSTGFLFQEKAKA